MRVSWGVGVAPQSSLGSRGLFIEGELGSAEQIHAARAPISRNTQLLWTLAALLSGQGDGSLQQELMLIYVRGWKCSWEDKTQLVAIDCAHRILLGKLGRQVRPRRRFCQVTAHVAAAREDGAQRTKRANTQAEFASGPWQMQGLAADRGAPEPCLPAALSQVPGPKWVPRTRRWTLREMP